MIQKRAGSETTQNRPEIIFVHLNSTVPPYIQKNISRTKKMFPDQQIVLITDLERNLEIAKKLRIASEVYLPDIELSELLNSHAFDAKFRKGFWQSSIVRLFAFLERAESVNGIAVHIESDVLLSPNFPWSSFNKLDKLAWLKFNSERDVAAIVSCPNGTEAAWLIAELKSLLRKYNDKTDMTLLSSVSKEYPKRIATLPIAPFTNSRLINDNVPRESRENNSSLTSEFGGFFDAAPVGMWLSGQDPRNNFGLLRRHVNLVDSYIDTSKLNLSYNKGRLFYVESGQKYELFNLHLHSKIESDFGPNWKIRLRFNCLLSKFGIKVTTFAPRKFREVLEDTRKRHGDSPVDLFKLLAAKIRRGP
jgi:hypothetical protein